MERIRTLLLTDGLTSRVHILSNRVTKILQAKVHVNSGARETNQFVSQGNSLPIERSGPSLPCFLHSLRPARRLWRKRRRSQNRMAWITRKWERPRPGATHLRGFREG